MAGVQQPASQAGIFNYYDAQSKGPQISIKIFLIVILVLAVVVVVFDHVVAV